MKVLLYYPPRLCTIQTNFGGTFFLLRLGLSQKGYLIYGSTVQRFGKTKIENKLSMQYILISIYNDRGPHILPTPTTQLLGPHIGLALIQEMLGQK